MKSSRNLSLDYKAGSLGEIGLWLCTEVIALVMKFLIWESFPNIITTIIHNKFKAKSTHNRLYLKMAPINKMSKV